MNEFGVKLIQFTNMNPVFKGSSVVIVGLLALLFAVWMRHRWKETARGGYLVFFGLSIFIVLYGAYILVFRPQWWNLPY